MCTFICGVYGGFDITSRVSGNNEVAQKEKKIIITTKTSETNNFYRYYFEWLARVVPRNTIENKLVNHFFCKTIYIKNKTTIRRLQYCSFQIIVEIYINIHALIDRWSMNRLKKNIYIYNFHENIIMVVSTRKLNKWFVIYFEFGIDIRIIGKMLMRSFFNSTNSLVWKKINIITFYSIKSI